MSLSLCPSEMGMLIQKMKWWEEVGSGGYTHMLRPL